MVEKAPPAPDRTHATAAECGEPQSRLSADIKTNETFGQERRGAARISDGVAP